jgi:hypothetical protein
VILRYQDDFDWHERLTRTHVVSTSAAKRLGNLTLAGKTKVGQKQFDILGEKHIFGLEVAMENVILMAMVDCVDQLRESFLDEAVIAEEYPSFGNGGKQVAPIAKIENHKDEGILLNETVKGDDVGVIGNQWMMSEFATLVLLLTRPGFRRE